MAHWVLLGDDEPVLFLQETVPEVHPVGRGTPAFPVHIQCRSYKHARDVGSIHDQLVELRAEGPTPMELSSSLYAARNLPKAFTESTTWFTVLNGVSFKGILCSEETKMEQTENHRWASFRQTFCLRDALIHIILGGDKQAFAEVTAANLHLPMDRLSLTAVSYHTSNAQGRQRSYPNSGQHARLNSFSQSSSSSSTSSASTIRSPRVIDRGRTLVPNPATRPHLVQTKRPPSPPIIYKYIRSAAGVVGSITNPTGVTPIDLSDIEIAVGEMRAKYLDAHGYGTDAIQTIADAYQTAKDVEDFVSQASGCGMSVVELEWFWEVSWCF